MRLKGSETEANLMISKLTSWGTAAFAMLMVCTCSAAADDKAVFPFDMYSGESLDDKGWYVNVKGTSVGDSLDGMRLIGEIDTSGRFTREDQ